METTMTTATCPCTIAPSSRLRTVVSGFLQRHRAVLKAFGPYAAIALVLPGGFLLALLLWLCRRHMHGTRLTG